MKTQTEAEYRNAQAYRNVQDWLDQVIENHEDLIKQLKSRKVDFEEELAGTRTRSSVNAVDLLSFAVNDLNNTQRNLRLDLVPGIAAELAVVREMMKRKL
jgi:hypothetical protein